MDLFILISGIIISLIFILAGTMKLVKSYEPAAERMKWTKEKSVRIIRLIALGEIIGALLFILPYYLNFLPFLSLIAALLLTVIMIGAPISHFKLGEHREAALTTFLLILMLIVTFVRVFI